MPKRISRLIAAIAIGIAAGIGLIFSPPAYAQQTAKVTFNPEISVGGAFTNDQLKSGSSIDLSQTGWLGGIGIGIGLQTHTFVIEPFGRYSYMRESGDITTANLLSTNLVEAGARLGVRMTKSTNVYGIVGYAWEDMKLSGLTKSALTNTPGGFMLGGGIEHSLGGSPWFVRAEYTHDFFDTQTYKELGGAKVTPDLNLARLGLTYKLNYGSAPNYFDTSKSAPESEGCDPKMFNCHHPIK